MDGPSNSDARFHDARGFLIVQMACTVCVIGFGYWGPNLARNFDRIADCELTGICDEREERRYAASQAYPNATLFSSVEEAINANCDAYVISTPVLTHYDFARMVLEADKHVLLEKPMTSTSAHAKELIELAKSRNRVLMVDHTFLYTGAVQKIKDLVTSGELGAINYFDSTRINLGLFQPDINVLWDLAPHDISILTHLVDERPYSVQATGISHARNGIENIAYMTVNYESDTIAHFNCSWSSPVKIRSILIGGDKKMAVFDDMAPSEKVKVYDTGYSVKNDEDKHRILVDYRTGDIFTPKLKMKEALRGMAEDFVSAINDGTSPLSDSHLGLLVTQILEASQESLRTRGAEVRIR